MGSDGTWRADSVGTTMEAQGSEHYDYTISNEDLKTSSYVSSASYGPTLTNDSSTTTSNTDSLIEDYSYSFNQTATRSIPVRGPATVEGSASSEGSAPGSTRHHGGVAAASREQQWDHRSRRSSRS